MTGRDYKALMKMHRESKSLIDNSENHKIFCKLADNPMLTKYQPVNYDIFKDFIKERRQAADISLDKVKKIEDCSKQKKESLFMKHHSILWLKEWSRLMNQYKITEAELENCLQFEHNSIDYINMNEETDGNIEQDNDDEYFQVLNELDELEKFSNRLNDERIKFKVRTVIPMSDLKEDLQYYLQKNSTDSLKKNHQKNMQIMNTIDTVKEQQFKLCSKLELEGEKLQAELNEISNDINHSEMRVTEGVPQAALDLECPDPELRLSVLQEFIIIDFKYKEKLKQLNESYKKCQIKYSVWPTDENAMFQHIYDMYHFHSINLNNCNFSLRDLMFDFMRRAYLNKFNLKKERAELVKYEEWLDYSKYHNQQQKLIITEWNESRRSLLLKAEAVFTEAFEIIEQQRIKNEEKEKQLRICNELYEKVSRWRKQKLEALEIQMKIDGLIKKQEMERANIENQKKNAIRQQQKQAIHDYNNRLEAHRKQLEMDEQNRLDKLKKMLNDQAQRDKDRIDYRNKTLTEKINLFKTQKQMKLHEHEEKEKCLEKITASRKPHVESDPVRMISYTEAVLNRRGVISNKTDQDEISKYEDKKAFYNNFSFTDKQINSDARIRLEQRLRQAGLMASDYARALIQNVKPPTNPRPDLITTNVWNGMAMKTD